MSYIMSRIRCDGCHLEMNVAFGIIGHSVIADWPKVCPTCGGTIFTKIADQWQFDPPKEATPGAEP